MDPLSDIEITFTGKLRATSSTLTPTKLLLAKDANNTASRAPEKTVPVCHGDRKLKSPPSEGKSMQIVPTTRAHNPAH